MDVHKHTVMIAVLPEGTKLALFQRALLLRERNLPTTLRHFTNSV